MKPEAQQIAIAEACSDAVRRVICGASSYQWQYKSGELWLDCVRNDPLNDLNAAVPLLDFIPCLGWRMHSSYNGEKGCWVIISNPPHPTSSACSDVIIVNGETFAKAICQTFLRAKGLWVE